MKAGLSRSGLLFCLIGPAGSGKTTIAQKLLKEVDGTSLSVSVTSRAPRDGEKDGVHYHFVSKQVFEKKISSGEFFEWEETHGNLYGTLKSTLSGAIASGTDLLLDIDIRGACNFKRSYPENTIITFLLSPTSADLIKRMKGRGAVSEAELSARMDTARAEYKQFLADLNGERLVDFVVLNDSLDLSYNQVKSILVAGRAACARVSRDELQKRLTL